VKINAINKDSTYYFIITFFERITFFLFYLILARLLSVEKYGIVITIFAFVNIVSPFLELGLPFLIQREIARNINIQDIFNSSLTIKIMVLPLYLLLPLIYFNSRLTSDLILLLMIAIIPYFINFNLFFQSIYYGMSNFGHVLKASISSRLVFFVLLVLLYLLNSGLHYFLLLLIVILFIQLAILMTNLKNLLRSFHFTWNPLVLNRTIKNSFPIGIGLIFITISDRVDILILEKLIDLNSVAFYAVAYTIFRNLQIISTTLLIPEYTKISAQYTINKRIAAEKFQYYYKYILIVSFLLIFFFYFLSNPLLVLLFGIKYSESSIYLQLLTLAIPGVFLNHLTGIICNSTLNSKIPAYSTGLGTLINLIVNLTTIPFWGIIGAVISTIITEYFIFIFQFVFLYKNDILNFKRS